MPWKERTAEYMRHKALVPMLSKSAEMMCAPFWWSRKKATDRQAHILNNGTICYLNTGSAEVGITANHVLAKYLAHHNEFGDEIECQFGGSTISPESRILAQNEILDLASILVPEVLVTAAFLTPRTQHKPHSWPPQRATADDVVIYGGYPGVLRAGRGRVADFPFEWIMGGVADVSERNLVVEPHFKTINWLDPEPGREFNTDVRGMSGGPIFRVLEPWLRLELVGFIYEFAIQGEAILARHADFISTNGTIAQQ